jgi:hypothetical protein
MIHAGVMRAAGQDYHFEANDHTVFFLDNVFLHVNRVVWCLYFVDFSKETLFVSTLFTEDLYYLYQSNQRLHLK